MSATTIPSRQVRDGTISTADIKDANVTFSKIQISATDPCLEDSTGVRVKVQDRAAGGCVERGSSGLTLALKSDGGLSFAPYTSTPPPYDGLYVIGLNNFSGDPTDSFGAVTMGWVWWETSGQRFKFYGRANQDMIVVGLVDQGNTLSGDAISNTTTETTFAITGSAVKYTIPAASIAGGLVFRFRFCGKLSTTGTPTLQFRVKIGGTSIVDFGAVTMPSSVTDRGFVIDALLTGRSTGVSGSITASAILTVGGIVPTTYRRTFATINTTIANDLTVTAQWGTANASNSVTYEQHTLEFLN